MNIEKGQKNLVVQSNKLTEARYNLSVGEQRLVLTILSFVSPDDQEFKRYKLSIWDLKKMLHLSTNAVYDQVKDALERLSKRSITIEKEGGDYLIANWFSSAEYVSSENAVYMRIDEVLKPYLLELKEQFTRLNLFTVTQFRSTYTIRIYMLLKQYESLGVREFDLIEFREILGIEGGVYKQFRDFNKRIIAQAKKDFEKKDKKGFYQSDITFDLETIRTSRKVSRLRFIIKKQAYQASFNLPDLNTNPITEGEAQPKAIDVSNSPTLTKMLTLGISGKKAKQLLAQHSAEFIEGKIIYTEQQSKAGKIKTDTGAFLFAAITKDWSSGAENKAKERKEQDAKRKEELKALFDAEWIKRTSEKYYTDQIVQIEQMLQGSPMLQGLRDEAEQKHQGNDLPQGVRKSAIDGTYRQLLKERMIAPPKPEDLEQLRASVTSPNLETWRGNLRVQSAMKEFIKEFSEVTTKES